jgi:hypothetical protein
MLGMGNRERGMGRIFEGIYVLEVTNSPFPIPKKPPSAS